MLERQIQDSIDDWVQQVMMHTSSDWFRVVGLVDWLRFQTLEVRVEFHQQRISATRKHQRIVSAMRRMGDTARILERRAAAVQRSKVLKAKWLLKTDSTLRKNSILRLQLKGTVATAIYDLTERRIKETLKDTGVSLNLLERLTRDLM